MSYHMITSDEISSIRKNVNDLFTNSVRCPLTEKFVFEINNTLNIVSGRIA